MESGCVKLQFVEDKHSCLNSTADMSKATQTNRAGPKK